MVNGLAVDARLEQPVDGVEEVVAVELRVEAEDAAAEQAVEQLLAPRADREGLRVGPGNVPEGDDRRVGQALADHPRQQREVVVLDQHHRDPSVFASATTASAKRCVDLPVVLPVGRAERRAGRARCGRAATGPRWRSRRSSRAPPPARARCAGSGSAGRPGGTATRSWRSTVSRSAEPLPCAIHVPEQARITGSSAVTSPLAGRWTRIPSRVAHVDVGLAVRYDDDVVAVQLAAQRGAQRLLIPDALAAVQRPVLPLEVADQLRRSRCDRAQLRRGGAMAGAGCPRRAAARAGPAPSRATTAAR